MEVVEVVRMQNNSEALVARALLEAHGIEVILKTQVVQSVHAITVDGVGEVRIMVRPEDAERARELLSSRGSPDLAAE